MLVTFNDNEYNFDLEDITVLQAKVIKLACGFTLSSLQAGLEEADPDALRAVFWLMLAQNGEQANIETVDFPMVRFAMALQEGSERQEREEKERAKAERAAKRAEKAGAVENPTS